MTAEKKSIYLRLSYKGDNAAERINRRIFHSLRRTFPAATLKSWFSTMPIIALRLKDRVPVLDQSMLVYSFVCSCTAEYVGRTTRCLSKRIKEHHPAWLRTGHVKSINSAVVGHLVETNHRVDPVTSFKIIYQIPPNRSKSVRQRMLATAESIAIRLREPRLCSQKKFVQALQLPWPNVKINQYPAQAPHPGPVTWTHVPLCHQAHTPLMRSIVYPLMCVTRTTNNNSSVNLSLN